MIISQIKYNVILQEIKMGIWLFKKSANTQ